MRKWKCPECGLVSDFLLANITGECSVTPDGNATIEYWEQGQKICDCGHEESYWGNDKFEIVEVND